MLTNMTPAEAMERINTVVSHAWMVRTFLKHAPEFEEDVGLMEIPRTIFDFARAVETRYTAGDAEGFLVMARKKLSKLRAAAQRFASQQPEISNHTNFQQAAISLSACVRTIEEVLAAVRPFSQPIAPSDQDRDSPGAEQAP